ncbi:hypothetical protein OAE55_04365 [Gammaproteobacteria bacterium]|nr:hypothetical protein [Gammaproteobacteria bacterium]
MVARRRRHSFWRCWRRQNFGWFRRRHTRWRRWRRQSYRL